MYVIAHRLGPTNLSGLEEACRALSLDLVSVGTSGEGDWPEVVLAVFCEVEADMPPPPEAAEHDAYAIGVVSSTSGLDVTQALACGYALALSAPLRPSRVVQCLRYLRSVAPPARAQTIALDEHGTLSCVSGSVGLNLSETRLLRRLSEREGKIVSQAELFTILDDDVETTVSSLKRKIRDIGSGAKVLRVPRLGYRLAGSVLRSAGGDAGPKSARATLPTKAGESSKQ